LRDPFFQQRPLGDRRRILRMDLPQVAHLAIDVHERRDEPPMQQQEISQRQRDQGQRERRAA
jgi:hypothetical protein